MSTFLSEFLRSKGLAQGSSHEIGILVIVKNAEPIWGESEVDCTGRTLIELVPLLQVLFIYRPVCFKSLYISSSKLWEHWECCNGVIQWWSQFANLGCNSCNEGMHSLGSSQATMWMIMIKLPCNEQHVITPPFTPLSLVWKVSVGNPDLVHETHETQLLEGCEMIPSAVVQDMFPYIHEWPGDSQSNAFAWHLCTEETGTTSPTNKSWNFIWDKCICLLWQSQRDIHQSVCSMYAIES